MIRLSDTLSGKAKEERVCELSDHRAELRRAQRKRRRELDRPISRKRDSTEESAYKGKGADFE